VLLVSTVFIEHFCSENHGNNRG